MAHRSFTRILSLTLVAFFAVSLAGPQMGLAEKIRLKAASIYPSPDVPLSMGKCFQVWQNEVTKRTNGEITFQNFWGAALGPGPEHIDLLKNGNVDVAQTFPWYTPGRFPIHAYCYVFPFTPTDPMLIVKANRKMKEKFPQFRRDEARQNVIMVSDPPGGPYDFMSRMPLKTLEDFEGEKVSLVGRYFGRWLPPGATAVVRPMHDRYELLQRGVVNIDLHPPTHFYATKVYELVDYYTKVGIMAGFHAQSMVNLDVWEGLSPEYKKIMMEAGAYAEEHTAKVLLPAWWEKCLKDFGEKGVKFSDFPQEEIDRWAASLEDIPAEWARELEDQGYPGFEFVKAWQDITAELGYEWPRRWGVKK